MANSCSGIPAKRSSGLLSNYSSVGERFNALLNKTNISLIAIRLAASKFSTIHNPAYVCFFVFSKSRKSFSTSDNTTHGYFFEFSISGKGFSMSDNTSHVYFFVSGKSAKSFSASYNATHVYFFMFSKPGKSFSTSDNTTQGYFIIIYMFVIPPHVHFCKASKTNGTPITLKTKMNTDFNLTYIKKLASASISFVCAHLSLVSVHLWIMNSE